MQMDEAKINLMSKHKKIHEFKLLIKYSPFTLTHCFITPRKKKRLADFHMQEYDNKISLCNLERLHIYIQNKRLDYTLPV